jgi:hypothetical protein
MTLKHYRDRLTESVMPGAMFCNPPTLDFESGTDICPNCQQKLTVEKTRSKYVATLDMGRFRAHEQIRGCKRCENSITYPSEDLLRLVPHGCTFGFDILVYVGISTFLGCRTEAEIRLTLERKDIAISPSEITYLAKKFIVYLALAHRESRQRIRNFMNKQGGYILHLDATCDGDSPHLMTGLDGISEIVLENIKLPSEKAEKIIPFLRDIKERYGQPLALVHDMGTGILSAVAEVFPDTPDYICHFHFLRDVGKDLLAKPYDKLRGCLRKHGIQAILRKRARQFKQVIDSQPDLVDVFQESLKKKICPDVEQMPVVTAYSLILWALEGKKQGQGYGFPFDQPHLAFYDRVGVIYEIVKKANQSTTGKPRLKPYIKLIRDLHATMTDTSLAKTALHIKEKIVVFNMLRQAMRIAPPDGQAGLNDDGEATDIGIIESNVKKFHQWLLQKAKKTDDYQSMIRQIETYWEKLFADPIIVDTINGKISIQPQRTNNVLERFFRKIKRGYRKARGANTLTRTLKTMLAETPLVKNLENEDYLRIILNGAQCLEERFAQIDANMVRQELLKSSADQDLVAPWVKQLIKKNDFIQNLSATFAP